MDQGNCLCGHEASYHERCTSHPSCKQLNRDHCKVVGCFCGNLMLMPKVPNRLLQPRHIRNRKQLRRLMQEGYDFLLNNIHYRTHYSSFYTQHCDTCKCSRQHMPVQRDVYINDKLTIQNEYLCLTCNTDKLTYVTAPRTIYTLSRLAQNLKGAKQIVRSSNPLIAR